MYKPIGIGLAVVFTIAGTAYWWWTRPPDLPDDFFTVASTLSSEGKRDEVMRMCSNALRVDPNHFEARLFRAQELRWLGRHKEALADLDVAIAHHPDHQHAIHAYYSRARAHFGLSEFDQAIADFDQAIRISPQDMWSHYWRGRAHEYLDHYAEAVDDYAVVIERKPSEPEIRLRTAEMEIEFGRFDDADTSLRVAQANANDNQSVIARAQALDATRLKRMSEATP